MSYFSKLDIIKARRTPLKGVLLDNNFNLQNEGGGNYRIIGSNGLIIKENYWCQHGTSLSGNTIDFFTKIKGVTFDQALEIILNQRPGTGDIVRWKFSEETDIVKKYLIVERCIDKEIVTKLIELDAVKQDMSNCICFIQRDEAENIRYIFRRSTNSEKTFKGEVKNSKKEFSFEINLTNGFISKKAKDIDRLYIVEGAIDACAMATLLKIKGEISGQIKIITTAGHPHQSIKNRIVKANAKKYIIATDMDEKGRQFVKTIESMTPMINYSAPEYNAKDPAELLKKIIKKEGFKE